MQTERLVINMFIKQLSIFIENKPGRLEEIMDCLSQNNINLRALALADTTDFGILRIIVDDIDKAKTVLKEKEVISKSTDVIAVLIDDKTGGLAHVVSVISSGGVGVEYLYAFLGRTEGKALMVIKTDDDEKTLKILEDNNIETASQESI